MRRKKPLVCLVLAWLGIALLASCGEMSSQQIDRQAEGIAAPMVAEYRAQHSVTAAPTPESPAATPTPQPYSSAPTEIVFWHIYGGFAQSWPQYVQALCDAYTGRYPNVTFVLVGKDPWSIHDDFLATAQAGPPPDLLWTDQSDAEPFVAANLLAPVDDLFDLGSYADQALAAVELGGKTWGIPISTGGHNMLIYNKTLTFTPPRTTDELLALAGHFPRGTYPLVYAQDDPTCLLSWLAGFGGQILADDGTTPTLDTPEMVAALQFLVDLRDRGIVPLEYDYATASSLFREGHAAAIIGGDWAWTEYKPLASIGEGNLGVSRIPKVVGGTWPVPQTYSQYFMIPRGLSEDKMAVLQDFIVFATNQDNQLALLWELNSLPVRTEALFGPSITNDPLLRGSVDQWTVGKPAPAGAEAECLIWQVIKPELLAILKGTKSPEDAARAMQEAAGVCMTTP